MKKILRTLVKIRDWKYFQQTTFVCILLFGFLLRLYKINSPVADWHSFRQADTASVSRVYVEKGVNLLYPTYYDISSTQSRKFNPNGYRFVEFPIYNAIHAILYKSFSFIDFEVWGRLLTIFTCLLSGLMVYLLGERYIGKYAGLIAAFFYVTIPFNIYFTRVILPDPLAVCFGLLAIWFFSEFLEKNKLVYTLFSGVFLSLAILVKPFLVFYSIPMLYLLVNKFPIRKISNNSKLTIKLLVLIDVVLIPFILWRVWISKFPEGIPEWKWMFNGDGIRFRPAFWRWLFVERIGRLILGVWGLIPFAFGLLSKSKNNFKYAFAFAVLFYFSIFATVNVRHDYYQILVIPLISLLLAEGSRVMWKLGEEGIFNKVLSRNILVFSLMIMYSTGLYQVKEYYKINHPEIIEAGNFVDKNTPKDSLVIAPYNGDTAFLYQTKRKGWPVIDDSLDNIIKRGADYYVSVSLNDADTSYISQMYEIAERNNKFILIDLSKPKKK